MLSQESIIGVIGCGAMGSSIAQVAATAGHEVIITDNNPAALLKAENNLKITLKKLVEKQKIRPEVEEAVLKRINFAQTMDRLQDAGLVIEAIVENAEVKKAVFMELEKITQADCILASNTSSLSITSIASACTDPRRVIGIHFFNPATLMPLVEIIPGLATSAENTATCRSLIDEWGKTTVVAKDTPGFIVNRVARPFYSEALRIYEEGIADISTIDRAMKNAGFRMGPFELMDLIGHDVNYVVTETVWRQFYYDPRYKPSLSQKRLLEAGFLGKKSGRGFYDYSVQAVQPETTVNQALETKIFRRILVMLINEAADALYMNIASAADIDLAMTKGVNYPKGLLLWADELGLDAVTNGLNSLRDFYEEDRYRLSPLLKHMHASGKKFFG
jgi:3-hydroxybutyryl-CoA dehydrogenase